MGSSRSRNASAVIGLVLFLSLKLCGPGNYLFPARSATAAKTALVGLLTGVMAITERFHTISLRGYLASTTTPAYLAVRLFPSRGMAMKSWGRWEAIELDSGAPEGSGVP
ncbi:hypothetical protein B0T10DRAFT_455914 [Thelonectria olida]|uniref:Uncharacterized protein n=1 Tax=Thelonectria olida TaxID=1576542 RepID=A0A9P8WCP0_9HYPO|nr:hypothetical protein B0T10DRAFT_455914 [Thelonectria olida]